MARIAREHATPVSSYDRKYGRWCRHRRDGSPGNRRSDRQGRNDHAYAEKDRNSLVSRQDGRGHGHRTLGVRTEIAAQCGEQTLVLRIRMRTPVDELEMSQRHWDVRV